MSDPIDSDEAHPWKPKAPRSPRNENIPKLLRAMAQGSMHREAGTDVVLKQAAEELESAWADIQEAIEIMGEVVSFTGGLPLKAHSVHVAHCSNPECRLAHIGLADADDTVIATAVLDEAAVRQIEDWLKWLKSN
jgi:hypothetical protein